MVALVGDVDVGDAKVLETIDNPDDIDKFQEKMWSTLTLPRHMTR